MSRRLHARRGTMPWLLASALAACGGKAASEGRRGDGGSANTGGAATGGSAGSAGTATTGGSSSAGRGGTGGATSGGDGGRGGSGGDAGDATGGSSAGAGGGEPGGAPSGGEGGGGNCVDVCALHGEACCIPNVECVSSESNCLVEVLAARLNSGYAYAELEQRVRALPQDLLLSFTLDDVDWVAADPAPAGRIELHMSAELGALHGAALDAAFINPFRVSCDGQALFVGVIYMLEGAAAFDSPVLHVAIDEGEPLILRLGARTGAWLFSDATAPLESRQRLDRAELRAALCLHGALREIGPFPR